MLHTHEERRPQQEAASTSIALDTSNLPDPADMLNGVHVVVVAYKQHGELRYRRRFYVNLTAAQRAHDRAIERGQHASIVLCRLQPAASLAGGWDA